MIHLVIAYSGKNVFLLAIKHPAILKEIQNYNA